MSRQNERFAVSGCRNCQYRGDLRMSILEEFWHGNGLQSM